MLMVRLPVRRLVRILSLEASYYNVLSLREDTEEMQGVQTLPAGGGQEGDSAAGKRLSLAAIRSTFQLLRPLRSQGERSQTMRGLPMRAVLQRRVPES